MSNSHHTSNDVISKKVDSIDLAVCIPTYRREKLLENLLSDMLAQSKQPRIITVIDGDPDAGNVLSLLKSIGSMSPWSIAYVPSNHGNAPYQRYLGWRMTRNHPCDVILFLDDDLRLDNVDDLAKLIRPFAMDASLEGVTAWLQSGDLSHFSSTEAIREQSPDLIQELLDRITRLISRVPPGGISPVGNRRLPSASQDQDYSPVLWASGRVMAFRMELIDDSRFSVDAFAMSRIRCGMGVDDTVLSRSIARSSKILLVHNTGIKHPGDDTPKAYPYEAYALAYAIAYSRRFINDHHRIGGPPTWSDRMALVRHYFGANLAYWIRALVDPRAFRFAYARGYSKGSFHGFVRTPTAKRLTPDIDWWADADEALARAQVIVPAQDIS